MLATVIKYRPSSGRSCSTDAHQDRRIVQSTMSTAQIRCGHRIVENSLLAVGLLRHPIAPQQSRIDVAFDRIKLYSA